MSEKKGYYDRLKLIQTSPFTLPETAVLSAIFSHADYNTGECWPSISTLCDHSKVSKSTVHRALNTLEARGVVERYSPDRSQFRYDEYEDYDPDDNHSERFHRQSNRYVLRMDVLANLPRVENKKVVLFRSKFRTRRGRQKWSRWGKWETGCFLVTSEDWFNEDGSQLLIGLRRAIRNRCVGHKFHAHLTPRQGWGSRQDYPYSDDPKLGLTADWEIEVLNIRPATEKEWEEKRPVDTRSKPNAPSHSDTP